jgi:hypothetical protein
MHEYVQREVPRSVLARHYSGDHDKHNYWAGHTAHIRERNAYRVCGNLKERHHLVRQRHKWEGTTTYLQKTGLRGVGAWCTWCGSGHGRAAVCEHERRRISEPAKNHQLLNKGSALHSGTFCESKFLRSLPNRCSQAIHLLLQSYAFLLQRQSMPHLRNH